MTTTIAASDRRGPAPVWLGSIQLLLAGYLLLGLLWATLVPAFEKPDEIHHYAYVRFVAEEKRIPVQRSENYPFLEIVAQHPPLYYAAAALVHLAARAVGTASMDLPAWAGRINPDFHWKAKGPVRQDNFFFHSGGRGSWLPADLLILRLFSLALGALTVLLVYRTGLMVFAGSQCAAWIAAAAVAFLPQFTFLSTSTSNDTAAALSGAFVFHTIAERRATAGTAGACQDAKLGLALGLAVLTKLTLLSLVGIVLLHLVFLEPGRYRDRARAAARVALVGVLVSGWWFWRNFSHYGDWIGLHLRVNPQAIAWDLAPKSLFSNYFALPNFWRSVGESLVGSFGFMHIPLPGGFYLVALAAFLAALAGVTVQLVTGARRRAATSLLPTMLLAVAVAVIQLVQFNLMVSQPQGRYLFHVLLPLALILISGLRTLGSVARGLVSAGTGARWTPTRRKLTCGAVGLALFVANAAIITLLVAPRYG
jgi:hypothetical protein